MINKLKEIRNTSNEEGFTLIELMIVVVIIGILAAIAIPIFMNQQKGAIGASLKSDVKNTNTNVTTALVKSPTATDVSAIGADLVTSDSNTTVTVAGSWDNYTVRAVNDNADPGCWEYSSLTGKSTECNGGNGGNGSGSGEEENSSPIIRTENSGNFGSYVGPLLYVGDGLSVNVHEDGSVSVNGGGNFRVQTNVGGDEAYTGSFTLPVSRVGNGISNGGSTITVQVVDGNVVGYSGTVDNETLRIANGETAGNIWVDSSQAVFS